MFELNTEKMKKRHLSLIKDGYGEYELISFVLYFFTFINNLNIFLLQPTTSIMFFARNFILLILSILFLTIIFLIPRIIIIFNYRRKEQFEVFQVSFNITTSIHLLFFIFLPLNITDLIIYLAVIIGLVVGFKKEHIQLLKYYQSTSLLQSKKENIKSIDVIENVPIFSSFQIAIWSTVILKIFNINALPLLLLIYLRYPFKKYLETHKNEDDFYKKWSYLEMSTFIFTIVSLVIFVIYFTINILKATALVYLI